MVSQSHPELLAAASKAIADLRQRQVTVHCLTNTVAQNFTANVLLAAGAIPSMTTAAGEVENFTSHSDAVLINLGTLDRERQEAMDLSASLCAKQDKPLVIDPVMCHLSSSRLAFARQIIDHGPKILRLNTDECRAIGDRDILSLCDVCVVTGPADSIYCKKGTLNIHNGHEWLTKVTAMGCAQGALMAALLPVAKDAQTAAIGAVLWVNIAGEIAAETSNGVGSFVPAFIDQIQTIDLNTLTERAKLS